MNISNRRYKKKSSLIEQTRKTFEPSDDFVKNFFQEIGQYKLRNPIWQDCLKCVCSIDKQDLMMVACHKNFIVINFKQQDLQTEQFRRNVAAALNSHKHSVFYVWKQSNTQNDHIGFPKSQIVEKCDQINRYLQQINRQQYDQMNIAAIEVTNNNNQPSQECVIRIIFEMAQTLLKIHVYKNKIWVFSDEDQLKQIKAAEIYKFMIARVKKKFPVLHYGLECLQDQYERCEKLPRGDQPHSDWYLQLKDSHQGVWQNFIQKMNYLNPNSAIQPLENIRNIKIIEQTMEKHVKILIVSSSLSANKTQRELKKLIKECETSEDQNCNIHKVEIKKHIVIKENSQFSASILQLLKGNFEHHFKIEHHMIYCDDPYDSAKIYWYLKTYKTLKVEYRASKTS